jgi:hypothetical protein
MLLSGVGPPRPLAAQEWDSAEALELVQRARRTRQGTVLEEGLTSYTADARGYVYFFVDHDGSEERNLVKTDQVALQLYWRSPNLTKQVIVGLRDEKKLPTNIQYHLDHLTVVQDDFGDRIRLGDGDEVAAVVHPLAAASERVYDFRLGDSLTIRFAGPEAPVRVQEIQVRPRDVERPGFVGSVYVDRSTAAVVRMSFTFTPASYVDSYLDYIRISLDNALWDRRYWLPHRQQVEIRREAPFFDFPMGSVIRGRFEISGYELNEDVPLSLFDGPRVTGLPEEARKTFEFEEGLYAQLEEEGLGPAPDLDAIRAHATDLARTQYLSGLLPVRLYTPGVSSLLRRNRAEGTFLGVGFSHRPDNGIGLRVSGGYALGRGEGQLRLALDGGDRWPGARLIAFLNEPRDIGPIVTASGAVNTLAVIAQSQDYQDLYFTSGVSAEQGFPVGDAWGLSVTTRWERQRTARDVIGDSVSAPFRPVLPTDDGDVLALDLGADWAPGSGFEVDGTLTLAAFDGDAYTRVTASATWGREWLDRHGDIEVQLQGGATTDRTPGQGLFLLGGRSTVPGYPFRSFVGDAFWLLRADGRAAVAWPWVSVRAFGALGGTDLARASLPEAWAQAPTGSARTSAGLGVDLLWNVVRLELGRGLSSGGEWELNFFASKQFWPVL